MTSRRTTTTTLGALAAAAALGALAAPAADAAGRCPAARWVGSWAAAPSDGLGGPSGAPLRQPTATKGLGDLSMSAGGTLRLIATPHLGGRRVRVRLSNRFGSGPLTLDHVTVARAAAGAALVPGSVRPLSFRRGQPAVTIPAGTEVLSDPVVMPFAAFDRLAVSVHVPAPAGLLTEHYTARQLSYIAPATAGDRAADPAAAAFATETTTRPLLAGIEVQAPGRSGAVVALGDSITDGYGGLPVGPANPAGLNENGAGVAEGDTRWPDALGRRLLAAGRRLSVLNAGISGNKILKDGGDGSLPIFAVFGPAAARRLDADVLRQPGATDVIVLEGINDIGDTPATAPQVIAGLTGLVQRVRAAGLRVHLGTLTPISGSNYDTRAAQAARTAVNAWIRTQKLSDSVVDFDRAVRDPADPLRLRKAYDSGDGLHPSPAGYRAMGAAVRIRSLAGPACAAKAKTTKTGGS